MESLKFEANQFYVDILVNKKILMNGVRQISNKPAENKPT